MRIFWLDNYYREDPESRYAALKFQYREDIGIIVPTEFLWVDRWLRYFGERVFTKVHRYLSIYGGSSDAVVVDNMILAGAGEENFFIFETDIKMRVLLFEYFEKKTIYLKKSPKNEKLLKKRLEKMPKERYYREGRIRYKVQTVNEVLTESLDTRGLIVFMSLP